MKPENTTQLFEEIARRHGVGTLEEKRSDREDFRDVAVWTLASMMRDAYAAGKKRAYEENAAAMPDPTA